MNRLCMALWVMAIVLATSSGGCETSDWTAGPVASSSYSSEGRYLEGQPGPGLVASPKRWVPDVALPVGFEPVTSRCRSEVMMHGGREVSHLYQGRAGQPELIAFYQKQLPLDGWRAYDRASHGSQEHLVFTKGVETLRLTIERWDARTSVWVRIDQTRPVEGLSLVR